MIGRLSGTIVEKNLESAVIDAGGVGYAVLMPLTDLAALGAIGSEVTIHVYTHVREDALRLYGFSERSAKELFEKLIAVSGIGPKIALGLLSGLEPAALARAIQNNDVGSLARVPGVGKKTAERLCLELRDKLKSIIEPATAAGAIETIDIELVSALESLGYKRSRADEVAKSLLPLVHDGATLELLVREALKRLQSKAP
ncbi:MAG: Holliday junction branch migration protein RuvA [Deltaproteobacteria bacterium]|nr:Holliday junction branch migration protein RuvA [Deltaproteobacteria bacterium]